MGDALQVLDEIAPDIRVINLETSITASPGFAPGKAIHYRMSPGNLPCVAAARPDVCALANNHVLDFGRPGLADTLRALSSAGLRAAVRGPTAEVFRGKLILYGCGDCIDDYEAITGHRVYRDDLRLLYFASLEADTGQLAALRMAPMQARNMRLHHAPAADRQWLGAVLDRISRDFG